jgi:hypothetical protein
MIRNIVLLDGTWNTPRDGTNISKLSPKKNPLARLILSHDGAIEQRVRYFDGVGTDGLVLERLLGGAVGLGLRKIVQDAYDWVIDNYRDDQELYIFGFSRGAYAARALAGLIGASGIPRSKDPRLLDIAWTNYRARKGARTGAPPRGPDIQANNRVKLLGVFDTVGSYGVPAGVGLAPLARYLSLAVFGFNDTKFGAHVDFGLHAVGVDERRRPFTPTFWTIDKGAPQPDNVEQTWFAGVHCNVGGGYPDAGLSDLSLAWMIARTRALTGLAFDLDAARRTLKPDIDGEIYDSAKGWIIDSVFPRGRPMFAFDAQSHGYFSNAGDPKEKHINERLHWSVLAKLGRPCTIYGKPNTPYDPGNLPEAFKRAGAPGVPERIARPTPEELDLLPREVADLAAASS